MFSKPATLVDFAIQAERKVLQSLSSVSQISCMKQLVERLDDASNEMCRVADLGDCLGHVHSNRHWLKAANDSFTRINLLMQQLNANKGLFQKFKELNHTRSARYEPELEAVIESFENDFERFTGDERLQVALDTAAMNYESNPTLYNLEKLIKLRFEQANSLGKASPAEVILEKRHFNTTVKVHEFLDGLKCKPAIPEPKITASLTEVFKFIIQICEQRFKIEIDWNDSQFCGMECVKFAILKNNHHFGEVYFVPGRAPAHYTLQCRMLQKQSAIVLISAPVGNANRLFFRESQSIFHEFGHAMHSILSETKYQALSGTRGSLEVAEIPSNLFECFHAQIFEAEPEGIDKRDVELAKFDQVLHSVKPIKDGWTNQLWPATLPRITIPHLAAYGASYYVYPLGKHVAAKLVRCESEFLLEKLFCRGGLAKLSDILLPA